MLRQTSINAVLAFGMTFVILTGGIDLSVGSVLAFGGIDLSAMPTSGIDGITDALQAVKDGTLNFSLLQDARGQAEGALDVLRQIIGDAYEPQGQLWTRYPELEWQDGTAAGYNVPWTRITQDNVDDLLTEREELTSR